MLYVCVGGVCVCVCLTDLLISLFEDLFERQNDRVNK